MKERTIRLEGLLVPKPGEPDLHNKVRTALEDGVERIVLDFEKVPYMDSAAVGELASCFSTVRNHGGFLALSGLQHKVKRTLQLMCFLDIFPNFPTVEEAMESLRRSSEE